MAMRNNQNKYLPEPLIQEILLRLPVKSLLRFKCVSKSWLSLISDPNFAKSHFKLSLSVAPTHRFLCYQGSDIRSIDPDTLFHDDPAMVSLVLPFPTPSHLKIQGSCRGFVMLQDYWNFIVWNPTTGVHKRISYFHIMSNVYNVYSVLNDALLYGFGYDALNDDYLIVIAWSDCNGENHFEYFSLRTNSWKNFEVPLPDPHMDPAFSPGFFLNGAIHWFAPTHGECTILAFDLITRKFSEIPLPVPIAEDVKTSCLQLLGGCLSMSFWTCDKKIEIWLMKEYKEQSSWTMYEIFDSHFVPKYLTKGGEIIGFDGNGGLMKYTDKGELLEHCAFCPYRIKSTMYTESLLSLPTDSGEAGEDDQQ